MTRCRPGLALAVALFACLLALASPASTQPRGQQRARWNLGTLEAGKRYPTTLAARNLCAEGGTFRFVVTDAPWLLLPEADEAWVPAGESRTVPAVVDLAGIEPGTYTDGRVRIRCLDCPPICREDYRELEIRLRVVAPEEHPTGAGPSPGETAPGEGPVPPGTEVGPEEEPAQPTAGPGDGDEPSRDEPCVIASLTWHAPPETGEHPVSGDVVHLAAVPEATPGGGRRLFPGRWPEDDEGTFRDTVEARAEVRLAAAEDEAGWKVYFKAYDVDDPSAAGDVVDPETSPRDNRGRVGARSEGRLAGSHSPDRLAERPLEATDGGYRARVLHTVPLAPGDNLRLVAVCATSRKAARQAIRDVCALQDDGKRARLARVGRRVSWDLKRPLCRSGRKESFEPLPGPGDPPASMRMSAPLTVWRYLHVERDVMTLPRKEAAARLPFGPDDEVALPGAVFGSEVALRPVDLGLMDEAFAPVFIEARPAPPGERAKVPFVIAVGKHGPERRKTFRDHRSTPQQWVVHAVSAYRANATALGSIGDDSRELDRPHNTALVYLYDIRRYAAGVEEFPPFPWPPVLLRATVEQRVLVHEVGHQLGLRHGSGGIMIQAQELAAGLDPEDFFPEPAQRATIRSLETP